MHENLEQDHEICKKGTQIELYLEHGMIGNMKWKEQREQNPLILSSNEYKLCVLDHKVFTKSTQIEFYLEHGMIGNMKSKEQKEQNPPILSLNEYRSFLTILLKTWNGWKLESTEMKSSSSVLEWI